MDRIIDLVHQLEPETPPPPAELQARQRDALLRSIAAGQAQVQIPSRRRYAWRSGWLIAVAAAAVAVAAAILLIPHFVSPPRPPVAGRGTEVVLTDITRALADTSSVIEKVEVSSPAVVGLSSVSWINVATGACRTDTSINGKPSLTIVVEHGTAVLVDYGLHEWWSRGADGVTCTPVTPQVIEHDLATGSYTLAGRRSIDGQSALELTTTTTTSGLHPVTKTTTLWVSAATYLPIESTSTGHLSQKTSFAWLPSTATNRAQLTVTIPRGFRHVATGP